MAQRKSSSSAASATAPRLGAQPPRYRFFLNPYSDARFTSCPRCGDTTKTRKLPLVIHIKPHHFLALNTTCRYCPRCDMLIAHQNILESLLAAYFEQHAPDVIGSSYLVVGTEDRTDWKRGVLQTVSVAEMLDVLHDFAAVLHFTPPQRGWILSPTRKAGSAGRRPSPFAGASRWRRNKPGHRGLALLGRPRLRVGVALWLRKCAH